MDGVIAGVGAVVVFLPQILLLFLFIGFLEDTGYMARAAFLMDRLMSKVGLHGKSFIPMLSSFACAIPGIMATRTIESPKDRLVTILVAPLMSCSARLPVYTLLIAACIPNLTVLGFLKLPGLTMLAMYLLGIVVALLMAWLFKKTLLKGETPMLIMELPPYKRPLLAGCRAAHVGPLEAVPAPGRHGHPGHQHPAVVPGHLSAYERDGCRYRRHPKGWTPNGGHRDGFPEAPAGQFPCFRTGRRRCVPTWAALDNQAAGERLRHSFAGRLGPPY